MYISNILLDLVSNLPLNNIGEALIASSLALLVWFVAKMKKKLHMELSPNGGSSTKDVLLRLESKLIDVEKELKFAGETVRFIHYTTKYCGFRTDAAGNNTMVTDQFYEFVGVHENELLGMEWLNLIPIEHGGVYWRDRVLTEFKSCLQLRKTYKMIHPMKVRRSGKEITKFVSTVAYPVVVDNKLLGTVGGFTEYFSNDKS